VIEFLNSECGIILVVLILNVISMMIGVAIGIYCAKKEFDKMVAEISNSLNMRT